MKITANHITIGRIVLLPVPCAFLLFGSLVYHYMAFVLFTIIAVGDLFDGMLARRQGPTQFGAMLDPLADKLFMACIIVPFGANGMAPYWLPAALLAREFVVTGLRTQTALRQESIKTSVLAKIKTSIQMAGFGFVFINEGVPLEYRPWVFIVTTSGALIAFVIIAGVKRKFPSIFVWVPCTLIWVAHICNLVFPQHDATLVYLLVILVFTWGSGIDYLIGAARILMRKGLMLVDFARLWWTVGAVVICTVVAVRPAFAFLVVIVLGAEFVFGGVDNLRALSGKESSNIGFIIRSSINIGLSIAVHIAAASTVHHYVPWILCISMAVITVLWATWDSYSARALFAGKDANAAYGSAPPPRTSTG